MPGRGDVFGFPDRNGGANRKKGPFPIKGGFGGSVPDSLYTSNTNSAWSRWRRGYELATADLASAAFEYPFTYQIPVPSGVPIVGDNPPFVAGVLKGFPTKNKELGMHWAGATLAGSLRFDNLTDRFGTPLSIANVTETDDFLNVQLAGSWDSSNPLPPPLFVPVPGPAPDLKPFNGFILEDRLVEVGGIPITKNTIDPATQTRYGYTSYLLQDLDPYNGILYLRKAGSVEATPDAVFITPARSKPTVGRFFINGTRYCCSCQDFNRRQYFFASTLLGRRKSPQFPVTPPSTLKPGRYEFMTMAGEIMDAAMTKGFENRQMAIVSPTGYALPGVESFGAPHPDNDPFNTNRDLPGVFSDFGGIYTRNVANPGDPALTGSKAESMPQYKDYDSIPPATRGGPRQMIQINDYWTPILDELRYCKHIYAMKFQDDIYPTEPSDPPVFGEDMVEWEINLVNETQKNQKKAIEDLLVYGLSVMDVPPMNIQAPMMMPMMQKLFNIPSDFIRVGGFIMYDKNGNAYRPAAGERPEL